MDKYFSEKRKYIPLSSINEESYSINNYSNFNNNINRTHKGSNFTIKRNINQNKTIKRQVMTTLLKVMEKHANIRLNNINSTNFIYQIYGKGIDMINHKDKEQNMNKTQSIANCMRKNKFFTPLGNNQYQKTTKHFLSSTNNKKGNIFNDLEKFTLSNKLHSRYKILYQNDKKLLKRSNSCSTKNSKIIQSKKNFALLPMKNLLLKKTIENHHPPVIKNKTRTSIIFKKKIEIEEEKKKEYLENLKIFSKKYEKEKEDFNNILFDECIEFRKKKFRLESFIKKFTNKHFVEKLYRVKENALIKSQ